MNQPNEYGVYPSDITEELARAGRSYVEIKFCQCEDGFWRFALSLHYGYGGFGGPISVHDKGHATQAAARDAGIEALLKRYPEAWPGDPQSVHDELRHMRQIIERGFAQPSLF